MYIKILKGDIKKILKAIFFPFSGLKLSYVRF